jgi:hypothetical protein
MIVLLGAGTAGQVVGSSVAFGILVLVMDISLVASSLLLGYLFARKRQRLWVVLFFLNLLIMLTALVLKLNSIAFSPFLLFGADIYWLNIYLVCLCCEWQWFISKPNKSFNPDALTRAG